MHTEVLLARASFFDDVDHAGFQLLNGGDVVGEDTHDAGFCGDVDLDAAFIETLFH